LIVWDRVVGYNTRRDSFDPAFEQILVLCKSGAPARFDKDAVREAYDDATKERYSRDNRYLDLETRKQHLDAGKWATNIWRVPSLKGSSREKVGHPTQKPLQLLERLVLSSSRSGNLVLDPFCGSGSVGVTTRQHERCFVGIECAEKWVEIARARFKCPPEASKRA